MEGSKLGGYKAHFRIFKVQTGEGETYAKKVCRFGGTFQACMHSCGK